MEEAFANLKKVGMNNVEDLMTWMRESQVITQTKEEQEKIRRLLTDAADKGKVTIEQLFKDVLVKVSEKTKENLDNLMSQLAESAPKFIQELTQGAADAATSLKSTVDGVMKDLAK